ncbi:NACHT domain-containing protein [Sorangium sp. So ce1182]|uniref:NACHT domain-containing protein n=1 Tax=Sorangium sp. So ce1182 TaxID=3133334 RepID=UPI003F613E3B
MADEMGRIWDRFGKFSFESEAAVISRFLLPLLKEFLGYRDEEIIPERNVPAFDIPQNRKKRINSKDVSIRPDFLISLDGNKTYRAVIEAKDPGERIEDHIEQILSYVLGVKINFVLITNGEQTAIYDANNEIYRSNSLTELDISFDRLNDLIGRNSVVSHSETERIALVSTSHHAKYAKPDADARKLQLQREISDFYPYLRTLTEKSFSIELPSPIREALGLPQKAISPQNLLRFTLVSSHDRTRTTSSIGLEEVLKGCSHAPLVLVGDSGIGKTNLLRYLVHEQAAKCINLHSGAVPIFVKLSSCTSEGSICQRVIDALQRSGVTIGEESVRKYMHRGQILLLLDAFDEVHEPHIVAVEQSIQSILDTCSQTAIILTTRPFRIPGIGNIQRYDVDALGHEQIQQFVELQLPGMHVQFNEEIRQRKLEGLTSNTLMLSFLLALYNRNLALPSSKWQILDGVVKHVVDYERDRRRFVSPTPWESIRKILSSLAFHAALSGESYSLDAERTDALLTSTVSELWSRNRIPKIPNYRLVNDLLPSTGFVMQEEMGLTFFHRTFLEYFASVEAAVKLDKEQICVDYEQTHDVRWEPVLPMAIAAAQNKLAHLREVCKHNIFMAAEAVAEVGEPDSECTGIVLPLLERRCRSKHHLVRGQAMKLVCRIRAESANQVLLKLLNAEHLDVQMMALLEIARRQVPDARMLVHDRLSWHDYSNETHTDTVTVVVRALCELADEDSQRAMLSVWKADQSTWLSEELAQAVERLHRRGKLLPDVRDELCEWFLAETKNDLKDYGARRSLLKAVGLIGTQEFLARLVEHLKRSSSRSRDRNYLIADAIASFEHPEALRVVCDHALSSDLDLDTRGYFAYTLSRLNSRVPVRVCIALMRDPDEYLCMIGVGLAERFPWSDIEEPMLSLMRNSPSSETIAESRSEYWKIQRAIFSSLAAHDKLELLLHPDTEPKVVYNFPIIPLEELFGAIGRKKQQSLLPLVDECLQGITNHRLLVRGALVLAHLGQGHLADDLIRRVLESQDCDQFAYTDIFDLAPQLPSDQSLRWLDWTWPHLQMKNRLSWGFVIDRYAESLQAIATPEARVRLKDLVEELVSRHPAEARHCLWRVIYALRALATPDLEPWFLKMIERRDIDASAVGWAVSAIAAIGTDMSLGVLSGLLDDARFASVAFRAIQEIYRRRGVIWWNDAEKVEVDKSDASGS